MKNTINEKQLKEIKAFSKRRSKRNDFNHNENHVELTVKLARFLAGEERADIDVCAVGAYLHDICKSRSKNKHGSEASKIARGFLGEIGLSKKFVNEVCYAISQHDKGSIKKTKEAKVLWDADKMQSIGPLGFMRIFAHHLLYDTRDMHIARLMTEKRHNFFYKRFQTNTGRQIAKRLHYFMNDFHRFLYLVNDAKIGEIK